MKPASENVVDPKLTYGQISDDVLMATEPPRRLYYGVMAMFVVGFGWAFTCWMYQVKMGMGVTGLSIPVGWAVYIVNFVFWVGIAHSGTLISAILHLVRSRWRTAIARSAEAMTVFAVLTAGLFPLIHLGRLWVFYYIIPYPSQRQLWPNFMSPLVWDVVAVGTYFIVSSIFWYVGLIPDLAAARDRSELQFGRDHPRTRLYRKFALGWCGSGNQWRHYGRAYLFFAALATPLVISVHSVVSWDFAMSLLPGWHTTIFPPYFVAGAIHSGLAMVVPVITVLVNLWMTVRGHGASLWDNPSGRFVMAGTIWYLVTCIQGPIQSLPVVQRIIWQTPGQIGDRKVFNATVLAEALPVASSACISPWSGNSPHI